MAAGQGFKTFTTGEVLTAGDVNGYLMQGVLVFASAAARDAAITSPQEGQFAFTKDTNGLWYYDGAAWVASGATGDIEGVTAGVGISGGGTSGTVTITNSMATAIDAKGDLVVGTGDNAFDNVGIGADGTVLTADSAYATGMKWATSSSGGMTLLSTTNLSGTTTTVSSISQDYINLFIVVQNPYLSSADSLWLKPNGGSSGNNISISGTTVATATTSTMDSIGNLQTATYPTYNNWVAQINNYTDTTYGKTYSFFGSSAGSTSAMARFGVIQTASAITSFAVSTGGNTATFSGGRILIYGVK
jgi:hypothetical protein